VEVKSVGVLIKKNPGYRLAPFGTILEEMAGQFNGVENMKGGSVLELGPGNRVDMIRFLQEKVGVESVKAVGRGVMWPWTLRKEFIRRNVDRAMFLDFFKANRSVKFDVVYSRYVMERHSINPWILLLSKTYWKQFTKKRFTDFDENYPSSQPNVHAVFSCAWKALKPAGVVISHIGKKKNSCLDETFLKSLGPHEVRTRDVGMISSVVTVVKKG